MSSLRYVGRTPDADSSLATKATADNAGTALAVTTNFVNTTITHTTQLLALPSEVDAGDGLLSHKTAVDAADTNYVPNSQLNQSSGVATLDSSGNITAAQVPAGVVTDRPAIYYDAATQGSIYLADGVSQAVVSASSREYRLASITVADPGYPWYPLCFAFVVGQAGGVDNGRMHNNNNYGRLVVQPTLGVSDTIYAAGIGGSDVHGNYCSVIPFAATNLPSTTPVTQPRITGSLQLNLYGSCWVGSSYVWWGSGLMYQIICMPAL